MIIYKARTLSHPMRLWYAVPTRNLHISASYVVTRPLFIIRCATNDHQMNHPGTRSCRAHLHLDTISRRRYAGNKQLSSSGMFDAHRHRNHRNLPQRPLGSQSLRHSRSLARSRDSEAGARDRLQGCCGLRNRILGAARGSLPDDEKVVAMGSMARVSEALLCPRQRWRFEPSSPS